jgi:hypothetical protein
MAVSGDVYIDISGRISEDIYTYNLISDDGKGNMKIGGDNTTEPLVVVQKGKETVDKK